MENSEQERTDSPLEYDLRKYLLLLATLVATVTYGAGFSPPGGVWQDTEAGHLAGDSIIRDSQYRRYLMFFYCNATAFALSIVVIILIFILAILAQTEQRPHQLRSPAEQTGLQKNHNTAVTRLPRPCTPFVEHSSSTSEGGDFSSSNNGHGFPLSISSSTYRALCLRQPPPRPAPHQTRPPPTRLHRSERGVTE